MNPWDACATVEEARDVVFHEADCGIGRLTFPMARRRFPSYVLGYDTSETLLAFAQARKAGHVGHSAVNVVFGSTFIQSSMARAENVMLAGVYTMLVFQHMPDHAVQIAVDWMVGELARDGVFVAQFTVGSTAEAHCHERSVPTMLGWCEQAGLVDLDVMTDSYSETWRWIVGTKER